MAHTTFYKEQPLLDFIKNVLHVERKDLNAPLDTEIRKRLECGLVDLRVSRMLNCRNGFRSLDMKKGYHHKKTNVSIRIKHFNFVISTFQVETTHIPRTYRIIGLGMHGPDRQKFPWNNKESGKIEQRTVQDYFNKEYNKSIKYPKLICIQAYPEEKNIYLPLEVFIVEIFFPQLRLFDSYL